METISVTKKRFESLDRYEIPNYVYNTEGELYVLPIKNRWDTLYKIFKRLYLTIGVSFGNKLQTINSLIDNKDKIDIEELVFPEKIAIVNSQIVGFTMPLIESINMKTAFRDDSISNERKIKYLKQIGYIIDKMRKVREYTDVKDFYLNDIHEGNFIIDKDDNVRVIDVDSCKINGNFTFSSKYLNSTGLLKDIAKYHKSGDNDMGYYIPDYNTDIYCYIIMIINFLYGDDINRASLEEFYGYLEYLEGIGLDRELLFIFEKILSNEINENPYMLLDGLEKIRYRSHKNVYKCNIRKK